MFPVILNQMEILTLYIALGIIGVKAGVFNKESLDYLSKYVLKMALPIMIFSGSTSRITLRELSYVKAIFASMAVMYIFLQAAALLTSKAFRMDKGRERNYRAAITFGNLGFIGLPIVMAAYPEMGMLYMAIFSTLDQAFLWTLGMRFTTPEEKMKKAGIAKTLKRFANPAFIAIILGVVRMLTGFQLPDVIDTAIAKVGATASPISMIYIGGIICFADFRRYIKRVEYYLIVLFKMIILPIALFAFMRVFGLSLDMSATVALLSGLPTVTALVMMSNGNGGDSDYVLGAVLITTIASIVTMPLISFIIGKIMLKL